MSKHTTRANVITSALRVLALTILLVFVWNQGSIILQNSEVQIEVVEGELEVDNEQELEDVLEVFSLSIHPIGPYNFNSTCSNCVNHNHCLIQPYLNELPSPPPEQA